MRSSSSGHRAKRAAQVVREIVASFLMEEARDPRIGLVTVTRVDVSGDLGHATVHYVVHGDDTVKRETALGLAAAASAVRRQIGAQMRLRLVPEVHFEHDAGQEHASRIDELLASLRKPGADEP